MKASCKAGEHDRHGPKPLHRYWQSPVIGVAVTVALYFATPAHAARSTDATTCNVLQAAYTAAINSKTPAYPVDLQPGWHAFDLRAMVPSYKKRLPATVSELDDLASRQSPTGAAQFLPLCRKIVQPSVYHDTEGHRQFVSFANPVFSSDRRLAVTEVSFREEGIFGYGLICIVRRRARAWTGTCLSSWIV